MAYIDSHAHLSEPPLLAHMPELIQRARSIDMTQIVNICTNVKALYNGLDLASSYPEIVNAGCTPPHDVEQETEESFQCFADAARAGKLVAIGETGLDYHYKEIPRDLQHACLKRYFQLAIECDLPVVFHCREAFADLFTLADAHYPNRPAVLHCFTGDAQEAQQALQRGWYISFSGILTFNKSQALRDIAKEVPLSQILLETDAPFLAPEPYRGKRNEPSYLERTAACLAAIRQTSLSEIAEITSNNAKKFYRL